MFNFNEVLSCILLPPVHGEPVIFTGSPVHGEHLVFNFNDLFFLFKQYLLQRLLEEQKELI